MRNPIRLLMLILITPLLLTGCWDFEEADQRGFVTTIGIDANPPAGILLSVQIPMPQKMLPPGIQGGSVSMAEKTFNTVSVTAKTVNDALLVLQTKTYRDLVVQQNKSIIIGAEAARIGVAPLLEFLTRNPKSPPQALIFITKGLSAKDLLSATPSQTILPGLMFVQTAQSIVKYDRTYFIPIWLFQQKIDHPTKDAYAPLIGFDPSEGQYIEAGLAAFTGNRMTGELTPRETQLFGMITGLLKEGGLTVSIPGGAVTLRNSYAKSKIKVVMRRGLPDFTVQVTIQGKISELTGRGFNATSPEDFQRLERTMQNALQPELVAVIRRLQYYNSDIIDFGEQLRVQHQRVWERTDWKRTFPSVKFQVRVKVKILGNGVLR